jgi:hypothetical protein
MSNVETTKIKVPVSRTPKLNEIVTESIEYIRAEDYKTVNVPRNELPFVWNLIPRTSYDEGEPLESNTIVAEPNTISVAFGKMGDGKFHLLGVMKIQQGLRDLPPSAELLAKLDPETGRKENFFVSPELRGDFTRYEVLIAKFSEPLKTKIYEAAMKHAGSDREMMVKD